MQSSPHSCRKTPALALAALLLAAPAWAQEVVTLDHVPEDMVQADGPATPPAVDLGERFNPAAGDASADGGAAPMATAHGQAGTAVRAARAAQGGERHTRRPPSSAARGTERAIFDRQPVRVPLPVGSERLITLPAPAALHVPSDMAQVARIEVIDRTIYATALVPFTPIRIVAELIDSGQQIPMDLVAGKDTVDATRELEVYTIEYGPAPASTSSSRTASAAGDEEDEDKPTLQAPDMVDLTRHAARQLYAPRRLAWAHPGVSQVGVRTDPVPTLIRGVNVEAVPVGQWQGGQLYVTAVRVTNKDQRPLEIPTDDLRGQWLAVTAQHGRLGAAGSDTDTTALYLVCARAFYACLR